MNISMIFCFCFCVDMCLGAHIEPNSAKRPWRIVLGRRGWRETSQTSYWSSPW